MIHLTAGSLCSNQFLFLLLEGTLQRLLGRLGAACIWMPQSLFSPTIFPSPSTSTTAALCSHLEDSSSSCTSSSTPFHVSALFSRSETEQVTAYEHVFLETGLLSLGRTLDPQECT